MRGIISDNTKTKAGKDFYDLYYSEYMDKKINASQIISLVEEFSFARNTKISITLATEVIYEFMARPDEEYLSEMAKRSVYATYVYLKDLEKQSKSFIQY